MDLTEWYRNSHRTTIFMHIPKTAGTTVHQILKNVYKDQPSYFVDGTRAKLQAFLTLPEEERMKIVLLQGHMQFGLHIYLQAPSVYFAFLRDPVERVISLYSYAKNTPVHYLYSKINQDGYTIERILEEGLSSEFENGQTRAIAGGPKVRFGETNNATLNMAIHNIDEYFAFIGLQENFDQSLYCLAKILRWKRIPFYYKKNVNKHKSLLAKSTKCELEKIKKYNQIDLSLFEYGRKTQEDIYLSLINKKHWVIPAYKFINKGYSTGLTVVNSIKEQLRPIRSHFIGDKHRL